MQVARGMSRVVMPGKQARALCPVCQEPMPPDETECRNCGAFVIDEAVVRLSRAFGLPREKALQLFEKGFRHPKQLKDRDVEGVLQRGDDGLLYICTNCGSFVATGETKCGRCGAEFEEEEPPTEPEERDILDLVLCPVCGADNDPTWKECEICSEPLNGSEDVPREPITPLATPATAQEPEPVPEPLSIPESPVVDGPVVEKVDELLEDLEASRKAVPRVSRVPKVARPAPRPALQPIPQPAKRPTNRPPAPSRVPAGAKTVTSPVTRSGNIPMPKSPDKRSSQRTVTRAEPRAAPEKGPRPTKPEESRPTASPAGPRRLSRVSSPRSVPPDDFVGASTVASGAALVAGSLVGLGTVAWGAAVVAAAIVAYVVGTFALHPQGRVTGLEVLLLGIGASVGAAVVITPATFGPVVSALASVPIALAARRLLFLPSRGLLVVPAGTSLAALALALAIGLPGAGTLGWLVGIGAALLWGAAVAGYGVRARNAAVSLRRELLEAERHVEREDYVRSLQDYDRAIRLGAKGVPGEDLPWYGKGATLILLGRYEEALKAIDTALDINPRNEVAWVNKGNALTRMGRLMDALRCFNAALKVNPKYEVAWNNRGNTLARLGKNEEALRCYDKALEIDPSYRGAWVNKGYVLTKLGRYDEASACADRALRASRHRRAGPA